MLPSRAFAQSCRQLRDDTVAIHPQLLQGSNRVTRVSRSALVPQSASLMYQLVADIEAYPHFLPWCADATIHKRSALEVVATLSLAKGPVRKAFSTRNTLHPEQRIELQLLDGPFKSLQGEWNFAQLGDDGSRVQLELEFEFSSRLLAMTVGPIFNEIANTMVQAFCDRARAL